MGPKHCSACGAELRLRPHHCPLCGAEIAERPPAEPSSIEHYQADVRALREQLKKLRNPDAEAV